MKSGSAGNKELSLCVQIDGSAVWCLSSLLETGAEVGGICFWKKKDGNLISLQQDAEVSARAGKSSSEAHGQGTYKHNLHTDEGVVIFTLRFIQLICPLHGAEC